jgi:hypothetical protein
MQHDKHADPDLANERTANVQTVLEHDDHRPKGTHRSFCGGPIWCDCVGHCRLGERRERPHGP